MRHRFNLFEKFCYPSVRRQTNQDFEWLVFFDANTEDEYGKRLDDYRNKFSAFRPIFVSDYPSLIPEIRRRIRSDTEYLITSRVDNDDAIHREFISLVQETFRDQKFEFVNFTQGLFLSDSKLYLCRHPSNAFVSLIEQVGEGSARTVWSTKHTTIRNVGHVHQIDDKPRWLCVVHERNASNSPVVCSGYRSSAKRIAKWLLKRLMLLPNSKPVSSLQKKPLPLRLSDIAEQFGLEQIVS